MGVVRLLAAGAVFLVLPAGSGPAERTVVLTAHHSAFSPARVVVEAGTAVRFVVRNEDPIDHELVIGDDATHRRHEQGREAHHHGDVAGEVSVPAGATSATTYRFATPGRVVFGCHLPGHWDYGMRGVVVVSVTTRR
ncbi:MAG: cupredoxin domain-containing protein [Actinomycetota bacterium]|nr:cupredoxin domain-containing protein [Actinomycetota bacterium]